MRRVLAVLPLLLLPACSGEGTAVQRTAQTRSTATPAAEPTPTPSPRSVAASPVAPATPSARATPTRAAAAARPAPAAQGDVDGDGEADLISYDENLAVELSGSGRTVESAFEADAPPAAAGSEDVDRDGRAEVFLRTGQGASTAFLTPFRYDGTTFAPLTLDGEQAKLGVGGGTSHGDGFSCNDAGALVVRSASSDDGTSFTVTTTTYRIDGHRLVQTDRTTATGQGMDDPRVAAAYLVDCRSVGEGG